MNKKFDCVEMKHQGAEILFEKLAILSPEEELAFWQKRTKELRESQQKNIAREKSDMSESPNL